MRRSKGLETVTLNPRYEEELMQQQCIREQGADVGKEEQEQDSDVGNKNRIWRPKNLNLRRGTMMGRRGPATPVPSWKLYENPFYEGVVGAVQAAGASGRQISVSARKLAASLWELQELPMCRGSCNKIKSSAHVQSKNSAGCEPYPREQIQKQLALPGPLHHSPKGSQPSPKSPKERRNSASIKQTRTPIHKRAEICVAQRKISNSGIENTKGSKKQSLDQSGEKDCTSREVIKVFERIRSLEEQNTSSAALAAALRLELENARRHVKELEIANKAARKEIESLMKKMADERTGNRNKEEDRMREALQTVKEEAETERKVKRKVEIANRKLARELGEAHIALNKVMQELAREKKARELMEDVCDELAKEIGQDKAEVEELKKESARAKEEVEDERRMLQMAEVWREERVQMKLMDARHELEERALALEKLKKELDEFLLARKRCVDGKDYLSHQSEVREAEMLRAAVDALMSEEGCGMLGLCNDVHEVESLEDDLHSLDLTKEASQVNGGWMYHGAQEQWKGSSKEMHFSKQKVSWKEQVERKQRMLEKSRKNCSPIQSSGDKDTDNSGEVGSRVGIDQRNLITSERHDQQSEGEYTSRYDQLDAPGCLQGKQTSTSGFQGNGYYKHTGDGSSLSNLRWDFSNGAKREISVNPEFMTEVQDIESDSSSEESCSTPSSSPLQQSFRIIPLPKRTNAKCLENGNRPVIDRHSTNEVGKDAVEWRKLGREIGFFSSLEAKVEV